VACREPQFDVAMARFRARDQPAAQLHEGGKQRDRAGSDVVLGHRARTLRCQRQAELRAFERLALALLVAAQHERVDQRIEDVRRIT